MINAWVERHNLLNLSSRQRRKLPVSENKSSFEVAVFRSCSGRVACGHFSSRKGNVENGIYVNLRRNKLFTQKEIIDALPKEEPARAIEFSPGLLLFVQVLRRTRIAGRLTGSR